MSLSSIGQEQVSKLHQSWGTGWNDFVKFTVIYHATTFFIVRNDNIKQSHVFVLTRYNFALIHNV